jgi:hypothetical protein
MQTKLTKSWRGLVVSAVRSLKTWDEFFERESGLIGSLTVLSRVEMALKLAILRTCERSCSQVMSKVSVQFQFE